MVSLMNLMSSIDQIRFSLFSERHTKNLGAPFMTMGMATSALIPRLSICSLSPAFIWVSEDITMALGLPINQQASWSVVSEKSF